MTLWVLSTQWLAVVYTHKGWAGWYNRQYPDLGRVDMSYELWAGDGAGWVECSAGVPATLVLAIVPSCVTVYRSRVCVAEVSSSCSAAASLSPCHPALGVITSTPDMINTTTI